MMMAYLDLSESGAAALSAGRAMTDERTTTEGRLGPVEWTIVKLAREDGLSSLREEGRVGRMLRLIFGFRRATPLASERLSWHHGYNVAPSELGRFYAAGYAPQHYETLLRHIGAQRLTTKRRNRP